MDSGILRSANQFLRDELQKRWPLKYKNRRSGLWVCEFPDGTYSNFHLNEYGRTADKSKVILRLNDLFEVPLPRGCVSFISQNQGFSMSLEMNFLATEIERAVPWLLDNYLAAKTIPDWLYEPLTPVIVLGKPVRFHLWTNAAEKVAQERHRKNRAREESLTLC